MTVDGLLEYEIPVEGRFARLHVDIRNHELRSVNREWRCPQELAVAAVENEDSTGLANRHDDVTLLSSRHRRVDPLHEARIGIEPRSKQSPFMRVVRIPVVAGQMLVIPRELAGVRIQGDSRVAI